ncbi:hypothetical protein BDW02DRAFT_564354 [Decorospora gaudefroyi]|uniref:Uncharacterized protein n=1 Tax=Decorospora gaudefroyi TaxID=184978 RepID=A0A6A5KWG9_9PLEO|nr:hypothetical protein BDW02DRAFT_564354 [Decorospora gaudefroyi]
MAGLLSCKHRVRDLPISKHNPSCSTQPSLAKHVGVSSPIRGSADLATIEQFVRSYPLPPELTYQIMVHHTLAKFLTTIVDNAQESITHSLVKIIDTELDSLKARYPTPWTPRAETANLTAKLLLYTTVIIRPSTAPPLREILMRNALAAAVRTIYLMDQGLAYASPEFPNVPAENLQRTLPKNYFRTLVLATTFLLRFFVLNRQASAEEQELARNHVAIAQRFLTIGAVDPQDERMRGAKLFERLSRQAPVDLEEEKLRVDDRMGASLVFDAVARGRALKDQGVGVGGEQVEFTDSVAQKNALPLQEDEGGGGAPFMAVEDISLDSFGGFPLPEDLWGDEIWGLMAPGGYGASSQFATGYAYSYN